MPIVLLTLFVCIELYFSMLMLNEYLENKKQQPSTYNNLNGKYLCTVMAWVYYKDGNLHRLDGPAIELEDANVYCIDGKKLTKEEWNKQVLIIKMSGIE